MLGVLIVTHGDLATELLRAAQTIAARPLEHFEALALPWATGYEEALEQIGQRVAAHRAAGRRVLILTDMFGDTPTQASLACAQPEAVAVVTGVNLPMVVRLGCNAEPRSSLADLCRWVEVKGRRAVRRADTLPDGSREPRREP